MIAISSTAGVPTRWMRWVIGLGGFGALVAFTDDDGPVLCPFRACTGMACPGCGLTRAITHAARGDLAGSFRLHPLALPLVALLGLVLVLRRSPRHRPRIDRWAAPTALATALVLVAVWLLRWRMGLLDAIA